MWYSPTSAPLPHGAAGIFDELLLIGAPLVVAIIIATIARRRARMKAAPRERGPRDRPSNPRPPAD